jgi:hypothetical protein
MKQTIEVLNIIVAAFRSSLEIVFGFGANALCGDINSNKKGDLK